MVTKSVFARNLFFSFEIIILNGIFAHVKFDVTSGRSEGIKLKFQLYHRVNVNRLKKIKQIFNGFEAETEFTKLLSSYVVFAHSIV